MISAPKVALVKGAQQVFEDLLSAKAPTVLDGLD